MRNILLGVSTLLLASAPLVSQDFSVPDDWTWQLDQPQQMASVGELSDGEWWYVGMPPGWHISTTESGVTLLPKQGHIEGRWAVEMEYYLFPNPSNEGVGIIIQEADGDNQVRFLMRSDGEVALEAHHAEAVALAVPWQVDSTLVPYGGEGPEKYLLRVSHNNGRFAFSVNGNEVLSQPSPSHDHRVVPGIRLGAGLNVHVSRFDLVKPLAPEAQ